MSGHSKWHSIKHQKAITDAKRGQSFTRHANAISAAAKQSGGDPNNNVRLRLAMEAACAANMPKDNIERAIKRGTGELAGTTIEEFIIEAFGPGGIGIMIEVITDNRNRALSDIRMILSKNSGQVAGQGAVAHLFQQKGVLRYTTSKLTDEIESAIIDSGASDYQFEDESLTVETERADLKKVKDALEAVGLTVESAQLEYVATTNLEVGADDQDRLLSLLDKLDSNDDVANIATNAANL